MPCPRSLAAIYLLAGLAVGPAHAASDTLSVEVVNFPEVQQIEGGVRVTAPIPQTRTGGLAALVAPAAPTDAGGVTPAGILHGDGFTHVTLSLAGSLRGTPQGGAVGLLLIPDVAEILELWQSHGIAQFAIRVDAVVDPAQAGYFSSASTPVRLAFPRYKVFMFNTTARAADATLYTYLSGS